MMLCQSSDNCRNVSYGQGRTSSFAPISSQHPSAYRPSRWIHEEPLAVLRPRRAREKLTVRLSCDEGKTWPVARVLQAGASAYSCLTVLSDMTIGCLHERGPMSRETIVFARFSLDSSPW